MTTITTLGTGDSGAVSRTTINDNFTNLNTNKAELASPTFTGTPSLPTGTTAVTQSAGDNSTAVATTAYADAATATDVSCRVYQNAVTVSDTSYVAVAFQVEHFDTNAFHDTVTNNSRLTIPAGQAGKYMIGGTVDASILHYECGARIMLNGTTKIASMHGEAQTNAGGASVSTIYDLSEGDYVELYGYIGNLSMGDTSGTESTNFWLYKIN